MPHDDGSFEPVMARLVRSVDELEAQLNQKKRLANELCREFGQPVRYPDVDAPKLNVQTAKSRDYFFGRPLATVVREFLEMRGPSNKGGLGAATVNEIYDALVSGGFRFETKDEANAKRGMRIALAKNTQTFYKIVGTGGSDSYGLTEWYPNVRQPKARSARADGGEDHTQASDSDDEQVSDDA